MGNVRSPIAANSGSHFFTALGSPATTTNSFAASAACGRPNTGADTYPCLRSRCSSAISCESATLIVLIET